MKFSEREKLKADFFETFGIGKGYIGYSDVNTDFYGNDFFCGDTKFFKTIDDMENANYNYPSYYSEIDMKYPSITNNALIQLFLLANQYEDIGRDIVSRNELLENTLQILIKHKKVKTIKDTIEYLFTKTTL